MIISFFNLINYVSVKSHENNAVISIKKLPVSDVLIKQKQEKNVNKNIAEQSKGELTHLYTKNVPSKCAGTILWQFFT